MIWNQSNNKLILEYFDEWWRWRESNRLPKIIFLNYQSKNYVKMKCRGNNYQKWNLVESTAYYISNNYILKQKITEKEQKNLKASLPDGFVALDRYFHQMASELEDAANKKDSKEVLEKHQQLIKTCMECHAHYAEYKFMDFQSYEAPISVPKKFYKNINDWR